MQSGIALVSGVVLEHKRGHTFRPNVTRKHDLQWLCRWRRRWKLTLGAVPSLEIVDADEAQRKSTDC